jgi:adenylylsulfate kinase-like enzyme
LAKVIWITGRPGTGKTTLAKRICSMYKNHVLLDSDELRWAFGYDGYSKADRNEWVWSVGKLAQIIKEQGLTPVVAIVSPLRKARRKVFDCLFNKKDVTLIYLPGGHKNMWPGSYYDEPTPDEAGRYFERGYTI